MLRPWGLLVLPLLCACAAPRQAPNLLYGSEEGDAFLVYRSTAERLAGLPERIVQYSLGGEGDADEILEALKPYDAALEELVLASWRRTCTWPVSIPVRLTTPLPLDARGMIRACRALSARIRVQAVRGDEDGALADLVALYKIGLDFTEGPTQFTWLVGHVLITIADQAFTDSYGPRTPSPGFVGVIANHAAFLRSRYPSFRSWMEREQAACFATVDEFLERGFSPVLEDILANFRAQERRERQERERHPEVNDLIETAFRADPAKARQVLRRRMQEHWVLVFRDVGESLSSDRRHVDPEEMKNEVARKLGPARLGIPDVGNRTLEGAAGAVVALTSPAVRKLKEIHAVGQVRLDTLELWCRLQRTARASGSLPETPEGLPDDPWDGKPLRYRKVVRSDGEFFILGALGRKKDGELQMRLFVEKHGLDWPKYLAAEEEGEAAQECMKWGVYRKPGK